MTNSFNIGVVIKEMIWNILNTNDLPLILYTDLKSLYKCLVLVSLYFIIIILQYNEELI
jgi:hypothetical protein